MDKTTFLWEASVADVGSHKGFFSAFRCWSGSGTVWLASDESAEAEARSDMTACALAILPTMTCMRYLTSSSLQP